MTNPELTDKQMIVLRHIIKHPNQTENQIVTDLKGTYSRVPIRKTLRFLSKNKIITMKQINSNKYEITPNYNDLLVILIQDLDNLEEKTVILIHQLERVLKQKKVELDNDIMRHLYFIYQHQILMYLLHALFVWPSAIKDSGILSTMYLTLFRKLRDILAKLEVKISSQPKIDMRISVINNLFNLTPDTLNEIVEGAKKSDIDLEVEKILDIIWKNSKIFYKDLKYKFDTSSQLEGTPKDWKTLIK